MNTRLQTVRLVVALACLISACGDGGDGGGGDPCGDRIVDLTWTRGPLSSCDRDVLIPQQLIFNEDGSLNVAGGCTPSEDGITALRVSNGVCVLQANLVCPDPDSEVQLRFPITELEQESVELEPYVVVFGVCTDDYQVTVEL